MRHFPGRSIGDAEITQFSGLNEIVKRRQYFFQRRLDIPIVQSIKIEIIGAQPSKGPIETGYHGFATRYFAMPFDIEFGSNDKIVTLDRVLRDVVTDNRLTARFYRPIAGIKVIAAKFEIACQNCRRLIFTGRPGASLIESHCSERKRTDAQLRAAECGIVFKMHA